MIVKVAEEVIDISGMFLMIELCLWILGDCLPPSRKLDSVGKKRSAWLARWFVSENVLFQVRQCSEPYASVICRAEWVKRSLPLRHFLLQAGLECLYYACEPAGQEHGWPGARHWNRLHCDAHGRGDVAVWESHGMKKGRTPLSQGGLRSI